MILFQNVYIISYISSPAVGVVLRLHVDLQRGERMCPRFDDFCLLPLQAGTLVRISS